MAHHHSDPPHASAARLEVVLRQEFAASIDQLCLRWLHQRVTVRSHRPDRAIDLLAWTQLALSDDSMPWELSMGTTLTGGRFVFHNALPGVPERAGETDLQEALVTAVRIVARRLQGAITRQGLSARSSPPVAQRLRGWTFVGPPEEVYASTPDHPGAFLVARLSTHATRPLPAHPGDPHPLLDAFLGPTSRHAR